MRTVSKKGAGTMKTRAECLKEYGSDYFIEKKIEECVLFSWINRCGTG